MPRHVAERLRAHPEQRIADEVPDAGVLFAVINFEQYYSEDFQAGRGCFQILNELVCDIDKLLPHHPAVDKIKTTGEVEKKWLHLFKDTLCWLQGRRTWRRQACPCSTRITWRS